MANVAQLLAFLGPYRSAIAPLVQQFEDAWTENALDTWGPQLPPTDDPLRRWTLLGLVVLDLSRNWQSGCRPSVEDYLQRFAELGTPATISAELLRAEYEA